MSCRVRPYSCCWMSWELLVCCPLHILGYVYWHHFRVPYYTFAWRRLGVNQKYHIWLQVKRYYQDRRWSSASIWPDRPPAWRTSNAARCIVDSWRRGRWVFFAYKGCRGNFLSSICGHSYTHSNIQGNITSLFGNPSFQWLARHVRSRIEKELDKYDMPAVELGFQKRNIDGGVMASNFQAAFIVSLIPSCFVYLLWSFPQVAIALIRKNPVLSSDERSKIQFSRSQHLRIANAISALA